MILIIHVLSALVSLAYTTYLFFRPSQRAFYVNYVLIATTLLSGTYLIWQTHTALLQACTTGLLYVGMVFGGTLVARRKFARAAATRRQQ